jgi:predicted phage terminase large subunit-like protein
MANNNISARALQDYEALMQERIYEAAEKSLYVFIKAAWQYINGEELIDNWHVACLAEHMQEFFKKKDCALGNRMLINICPRSGKTMNTTVMGTAWQWIQDPNYRIIHTTHTERLYVRNIASIRQLLSSPWYKDRWCNPALTNHYRFSLSQSQNTKTWLQLEQGGEFYGTSPGSSNVYGAGGDLLSIDDPTDGSSAHQPIVLERANRFYSQTLKTRLNNKKTGKIMVVQQRLAQNDLSGWILEHEREDYFHLNIPMLYDSRRTFVSPIGFNDHRRKDGESLDPLRFPPEFIDTEKKNFSYFQTQYQQDPVPEGGNLIQLDWLQYYNRHDFDSTFSSTVSQWLSVWDLSFDGGTDNDYTVGLVLAYTTDGKFVVYDLWREKATFTRQLQMMRELVNKHPQVCLHLVENLANGTALINTLQREINGLTPILPRTYGHSKSMRLQACVPAIMEGRLWIPRDTTYSVDVVKELVGFPLATNDDIVDCIAYAINHCLVTQDIGVTYTGLHKMVDTPLNAEEKARALSTLAYDYQKERVDVLGSTSNSNIRSIFY